MYVYVFVFVYAFVFVFVFVFVCVSLHDLLGCPDSPLVQVTWSYRSFMPQ